MSTVMYEAGVVVMVLGGGGGGGWQWALLTTFPILEITFESKGNTIFIFATL